MPDSMERPLAPAGEWTFDPETGFLSLRKWMGEELPALPLRPDVYGISLEECMAQSAANVERYPSFRELRLSECRFERKLIAARQRRLTFITVKSSLDSLEIASVNSLQDLRIANDHLGEPATLPRLASLTVTNASGDPLALLTGGDENASLDVTDSALSDDDGGTVRVERARFRNVSGLTGAWVRRMSGLQSATLQGRCDGAVEALVHAPDLIRLRVPGDTPLNQVEDFARSRPEVRLYLGLRSYERYRSSSSR